MSTPCPRCQKELESAQVDNIQVRLCQGCRGMLLAHPDLVQVLDSSWRAVSPEQVEKLSFVAPEHWQQEPVLRCPDCQQAMEKYGYMGLAAILIDRCNSCSLVWLDADELQNMVLALAKTNYRSQQEMNHESRDTDFVESAMQSAAFPAATTSNDFNTPMSDGLAVVGTLLRLFLR